MRRNVQLRGFLKLTRVLLIVPFFSFGGAQSSSKSIEDWFKLSWEHSPEVKSSEAQVDVAQSVRMLSNSNFLPSLNARYQFRENEKTNQTKVLSLNAEQNFFRGFKDYHERQEAYKLVDAEKSALGAKKLTIARSVSETLLKLASTTAQKSIYEENAKILERRLTEFKRRIRIGKTRDVELIQNQIDRLQLERLKASNERTFATAVATLNEYTGEVVKSTPYSLSDLLLQLASYHSSMDKKSLQREELQLRVSAQDSAVKGAWGTFLPTIKGVASYYPENDSRYSKYVDDWSVGVDLEWKFFEGFASKAQVNQEKALKASADAKLSKFEYNDTQSVQSLKAEWEQLVAERKLLIEAQALSDKEFKAQERDFKLGLVTVLELTTTDEQYLTLRQERVAVDEKLGLILSEAIERGGIEGLRL